MSDIDPASAPQFPASRSSRRFRAARCRRSTGRDRRVSTATEVAPAVTEQPPPTALPAGLEDASAFVRSYYAIVNAEDYERGWSLLSEAFRQQRGQSSESYAGYWQAYDVEVHAATVVRATADGRTVVRVEMAYASADGVVEEIDELTVQRADAGGWAVVDQLVVG